MKSLISLTLLCLLLIVAHAHADCDDSKSSEEGEIKSFFKNIGCKIQEGAEDLQQKAKPWAEKIGQGAKDLGSNVAQKYDDLKHKLTDDGTTSTTSATPVRLDAPTEKVPLAPLNGEPKLAAEASPPLPATGEPTTKQTDEVTPQSIDDRFLLQQLDCPKGEVMDHRSKCRPSA